MFILLLVAWKSIRVDPMLTCCHAFNLSVDFHATVCVFANVCCYTWHVYLTQITRKITHAMYVRYAVTEHNAVSVIILYFSHSSFIYFNSIIFNHSVRFLLLV